MESRTENDWRALARAEQEGREPPGTVARLLRESEGKSMISLVPNAALPSGKELEGLALLASLVQLLSDPASAKRATDYHASATEYREQAMRAEYATRNLAETQARLAEEQSETVKKHEAAIARLSGEFDAHCKERAQLLADREAALAKKEARAEETLRAATEMKTRFERKLALLKDDAA